MSEQAIKIMCFALAEYARIEAMKAANTVRTMNGEALAYSEESFNYAANTLDQLALEVINQ